MGFSRPSGTRYSAWCGVRGALLPCFGRRGAQQDGGGVAGGGARGSGGGVAAALSGAARSARAEERAVSLRLAAAASRHTAIRPGQARAREAAQTLRPHARVVGTQRGREPSLGVLGVAAAPVRSDPPRRPAPHHRPARPGPATYSMDWAL